MPEEIDSRVIFLFVFFAITLIQWILKRIAGKKDPPPPQHWEEYDYKERADTAQPPNSLEDLYEAARREILERQNRSYPTAGELREKISPPTRRPTPTSPPKTPPSPVAPAKKVRKPRVLTDAEVEAAARFALRSAAEKKEQTSANALRIRKMLTNPNSVRDAVILAEILGPRRH